MENETGVLEDINLTGNEQNRKRVFEDKIKEAAMAPFKVGEALDGIKEEKLYRDEYPQFAAYCEEKWGIGKSRCYQLIGAHKALKNLEGCPVLPGNERQIRPLLELTGPEQKNAWEKCVEQSKTGKVTFSAVREYVSSVIGESAPSPPTQGPTDPGPTGSTGPSSATVIDTSDLEFTTDVESDQIETEEKDIIIAYNNFLHAIQAVIKSNYKLMAREKVAGLLRRMVDLLKMDDEQ